MTESGTEYLEAVEGKMEDFFVRRRAVRFEYGRWKVGLMRRRERRWSLKQEL